MLYIMVRWESEGMVGFKRRNTKNRVPSSSAPSLNIKYKVKQLVHFYSNSALAVCLITLRLFSC